MKTSLNHLLKLYRNLSIKKKLLLILYAQIVIPLLLIGFMSYKISSDIIQQKSKAYSQDILRMIELRLKDYVENLSIISQDLLYDREIYSILKNDSRTSDRINAYENEDRINNILKKVILSRDEMIQSICFLSTGGKMYFFNNNSKKIDIKGIVPFGRIMPKAREGQGKVVWYLDCDGKKVKNIFLARTVYNQDNFKEIGLMVILVDKKFLETVYRDLETKNLQNIAIMSSKYELIASRNDDSTYLFDSYFQAAIQNGRSPVTDRKAGTLISFVSLEQPDWKVVTYITLRELNKEIDLLRQWIILLSVLSVILLSVLSVYIAVDFVTPINRLVKGMKKVQKGEGNVSVEIDREDELGFLNKTFNTMAEEIHYLVNCIYREQITRKDAEIKALQSQINPHFLFNTLESINWMAQLNNVPEISETVSDLSALMEAGIGRDDRLITLEEEFSYADKYISLLKRRFEDRIDLKKNVREEALTIKIPRLLIQPLIENAVFHGVEKTRGKGIINLDAYIDGNMLIIKVKDNGMGIEKEELDILNERLAMDNDTYFKTLGSKKNKSIGIENVNRRIKLFYGDEYGLVIESKAGEFTSVTVLIPLRYDIKKEDFYVQGGNN